MPPIGVCGMGSFPVQSGVSLINFQVQLGVGKLALNRQLLTYMC